jgi:hypothetical protein
MLYGGVEIGPFEKSRRSIEKFGANIYMNYLYGETIEQLMVAEKELDVAIKLESTESEIEFLKEKVEFLESIVSLATKNYENSQKDDSMRETEP